MKHHAITTRAAWSRLPPTLRLALAGGLLLPRAAVATVVAFRGNGNGVPAGLRAAAADAGAGTLMRGIAAVIAVDPDDLLDELRDAGPRPDPVEAAKAAAAAERAAADRPGGLHAAVGLGQVGLLGRLQHGDHLRQVEVRRRSRRAALAQAAPAAGRRIRRRTRHHAEVEVSIEGTVTVFAGPKANVAGKVGHIGGDFGVKDGIYAVIGRDGVQDVGMRVVIGGGVNAGPLGGTYDVEVMDFSFVSAL